MTERNDYTDTFVTGLQWMWGDGFLSPGGASEVAEILHGLNLTGKSVLDIGCGLGGADLLLVREHNAARVIGIDVEASLVAQAKQSAANAGLSDRLDFKLVTPGPLPFGDDEFDVVFSKDSMIHIPDKKACYRDIQRVLTPQGMLALGDWFGPAEPLTPEMEQWLKVVGLDFSLGTLEQAADLLKQLGFTDVQTRDRNAWYAAYMQEELASVSGENQTRLIERIGEDAARHRLLSSSLKQTVVNQGQLRPGHIQAISQK